MLDFITVPLVTFVVFYGIYSIFDLFVRRKERMEIIERMGDKLDSDLLKLSFGFRQINKLSFSALKLGSLLCGIGLGLFIGSLFASMFEMKMYLENAFIGGSVLLFGGLGLIAAFVIELKMSNKKNQ